MQDLIENVVRDHSYMAKEADIKLEVNLPDSEIWVR